MERLCRLMRWPWVALMLVVLTAALTAAVVATIERSVREDVQAALDDAGLADVTLAGVMYRSVELEGPDVLSSDALAAIEALAATRDVTYSTSEPAAPSTAAPSTVASPDQAESMAVRGSFDGVQLSLRGTVPDTTTRDAILAAARDAFGVDSVAADLGVAGVEPTEAVGAAAASLVGAMEAIAEHLLFGEVSQSGAVVSVSGQVASDGAGQAIRSALGSEAQVDLTVLSPLLAVTAVVDAGSITITGSLPDAASRSTVLDSAARAFGPANVADSIETQGVAPTPEILDALADIDTALALLANDLESGEVAVTESNVSITGVAGSPGALSRLESGFEDLAALRVDLDVDLTTGAQVMLDIEQTLATTPVSFEPGSDALTPGGADALDAVAAILIAAFGDDPNVELLIAGHTDDQGDDDINLALSLARASAVRTYLVDAGIPGQGLTAVGFGETQPVAANDTPEGRAQNSRIEFTVLEG